jgi:phage terminase large subunit-like protein
MEHHLCHGPGDLRGDPVTLTAEAGAFLVRAYELDPVSGRRKVRRAVLSRPKGWSKSELAGMVACAELLGPVRFDGWAEGGEVSSWGYVYAEGEPMGRPVRDPFIRCLATEEGQAGNTYSNVTAMLEHVSERFGNRFPALDVGLTRTFLAGGGEIRPSTAAAASKDGGKESFAIADESHLNTLPELHGMFETVSRNLAKRQTADPWLLETTTAPQPGQRSVAELTLEHWTDIKAGKARNRGLFVDHREGDIPEVWDDDDELLDCLRGAYGDAGEWADFDAILAEIRRPSTSKATAARYFLNRALAEAEQWISPGEWAPLTAIRDLPEKTPIALGWDGAESSDASALVACTMEDPHLFVLGIWRAPEGDPEWTVPREEVKAVVADAFTRYKVARMLCDPPYWQSELAEWAARYGDKVVLAFPTASWSRMALAVERLSTAIRAKTLTHDDDPELEEHIYNAGTAAVNPRRPDRGYVLVKERRGSPRKIDAAVASVLAYEARDGAIAAGWKPGGRTRFYSLADIPDEDPAEFEAEVAREMARLRGGGGE